MKKALLIAAAALSLLAMSCTKKVEPVNVSVTVDASALAEGVPAPASYSVSVTNLSTAEVQKADTENGAVSFILVPGLYQVDASASASAEGRAYHYVGQEASVNITTSDQAVSVKVAATESSALAFKEIYYTNSGTNYYIREQFYEVYNNSDQTVYLDGLCIAQVVAYDYENKPYNFEIDNPEKYVFAQQVWQVSGEGTTYPLAPGESAVIAQWATNHSLATLNPASAIGDLSSAEFEALEKENTTWSGLVLTDNKAINLKNIIAAYPLPQWLSNTAGPSMILFYPEGTFENNELVAAAGLYKGAKQIPIDWIIDGVNTVEDETKIQNKSLPASIDAGVIWCTAAYSGESISRRISETTPEGRIIYQDTNNTSNDFVVNVKPMIRRNNPGIPSWNTWAK